MQIYLLISYLVSLQDSIQTCVILGLMEGGSCVPSTPPEDIQGIGVQCILATFLFKWLGRQPSTSWSTRASTRQSRPFLPVCSTTNYQFPILQAFLAPLLPQGLSCLSLQMWHNGAAVDYQLVSCFNGFFVQITVDVNSILMDNIRLAAPLIIAQLHIDQVVLTDPQLLQVTAFVPGADTLIFSRSFTMTEKRNLDSMLRQRFTDMRNVGFLLLTAHPSSKWMDLAFSPRKEKVMVVYSDEVLQEGAIYVRRRLRLCYLIRQLASPFCVKR